MNAWLWFAWLRCWKLVILQLACGSTWCFFFFTVKFLQHPLHIPVLAPLMFTQPLLLYMQAVSDSADTLQLQHITQQATWASCKSAVQVIWTQSEESWLCVGWVGGFHGHFMSSFFCQRKRGFRLEGLICCVSSGHLSYGKSSTRGGR